MRKLFVAALAAVTFGAPALAATSKGVESYMGSYRAAGVTTADYQAALTKYHQLALGPRTPKLGTGAFTPPAVPITTGPAGDYASEMAGEAGLDHWSLEQMPLRVYIAGGSAGYRPSYEKMFVSAMNEWSAASGGRIRWTRVSDPSAANIIANWDAANASQPGEAGNTRTQYGYGADGQRYLAFAEVSLMPLLRGQPYSDEEMHKVCLHEIGHALGMRHSSHRNDIMYWQSNAMQMSALGPRDTQTIRRLYSL